MLMLSVEVEVVERLHLTDSFLCCTLPLFSFHQPRIQFTISNLVQLWAGPLTSAELYAQFQVPPFAGIKGEPSWQEALDYAGDCGTPHYVQYSGDIVARGIGEFCCCCFFCFFCFFFRSPSWVTVRVTKGWID